MRPLAAPQFRVNMKAVYRLCLVAVLAVSSFAWGKPVLLDQAIAVVNNQIITQTDYNYLKQNVARNAQKANRQLPPEKALRRQLLDKLIDDQLVLQQAEKMGLSISDTQLDQAIEGIIQDSGQNRKQYLATLQQEGISYREFRSEVRQQILVSQTTQSAVRRRVHVDKQAINTLMARIEKQGEKETRYHIEHIMLRFGAGKSKTQVQTHAQLLMKKLKAGANFAQVAMSNSQGPKALKGGDWGWMNIESMPTIFAQVVPNQSQGALIGPFRSEAGYHILKIAGIKGNTQVKQIEVKARHILIKPSIIMSDKKAKQRLEQIRADIIAGKGTFAQYARKYSQDTGSAVRGGELGWSDPSAFVPNFKKMVLKLPLGKISQPFHSQFGWHIVEVEKRRKADKTQEAMQKRAFQILYQRQFNEQKQTWVDQLRRHAYIKINKTHP